MDTEDIWRGHSTGDICKDHGCVPKNLKFPTPVQKKDAERKVLVHCSLCGRKRWVTLPDKGYQAFLSDLENGNVH